MIMEMIASKRRVVNRCEEADGVFQPYSYNQVGRQKHRISDCTDGPDLSRKIYHRGRSTVLTVSR